MNQSATSPTTTAIDKDDIARLVLRLVLGVLMIAHGYQKLTTSGLNGIGDAFEEMGVPGAQIAGPLMTLLEFGGGIAMVLGLLTPLIGGLFAIAMLGAIVIVHGSQGFYVSEGGYEFVLLLAAVAGYLAVVGAGKLSIDHFLAPKVFTKTSS